MAYKQVSYVVVLNTSRLWRSDMAKVLIQRELKKHEVDVKAIEQSSYSIYTHDPNDFLVNGMLELLDQYQRLEIALKLSRGRKRRLNEVGMQVAVYCLVTRPKRTKGVRSRCWESGSCT